MNSPSERVQLVVDTTLGPMHLAASPRGLAGAWFAGQRHAPAQLDGAHAWPLAPEHPLLRQARDELQAYLQGRLRVFSVPLDLSGGTPFQQAVWQALLHIPCGQLQGYGALAAQLGRPSAARAVGAAVGRNPVSVIVPCHRVVGADGSLTGYAGGLERKQALLRLEGVAQRERHGLSASQAPLWTEVTA